MPHFRTWDSTYYDFHGSVDLDSLNIGIGELQTDPGRRVASYQHTADDVPYNK